MSLVDAHLEIDPEHVIEFVLVDSTTTATTTALTSSLTTASTTHKVTLTLKNPDADGLPIAFKVRVCWNDMNIYI